MNTTVKKVVVKKTTKNDKEKLYKFNNREFSSVSSLINSILNEFESDDLQTDIQIKFNNKILEFELSQNIFCCGLIELGGLKLYNINQNRISNLDSTSEKLFLDIMNEIVNLKEGNTLMLTTNGTGYSLHFEKVLSKSNSWTDVKKFKNSNSNNNVTIWISNNY